MQLTITHNELKLKLYEKSLELCDARLLGCLNVAKSNVEEFRGICYFLWSLEVISEEELDNYNIQYWEEREKIEEELRKVKGRV